MFSHLRPILVSVPVVFIKETNLPPWYSSGPLGLRHKEVALRDKSWFLMPDWVFFHSGCSNCDQPLGTHTNKNAVSSAELPGTTCLHPVFSGTRWMDVSLERLGSDSVTGCSFLRYGLKKGIWLTSTRSI